MTENKKTLVHIAIWTCLTMFILAIGMYYFPHECPDLGFWGSLYYTIRLFIMEHDLGHFPNSWPLVFIYFFAPIVALSVVGTAISYFFKLSPVLRTKWKYDHVVVCGLGRTGRILAATLKQEGVSVVGVDSECPEQFDEWSSKHNIPIIYGNLMSHVTLKKAGTARARAVIFASGDDLLNLEGVVGAYGWLQDNGEGPIRLLWAHIASEKLADTARFAMRTRGNIGIRFFDTYHIAAIKMVEKYFTRELRQKIREITILGFGKFGRDLMDVMVRNLVFPEKRLIRVIDIQDRRKEVCVLAEELNIAEQVTFAQTDINDLDMADSEDKAFFLCTDDDIGNLAGALMLTRNISGTHVYVRMATWPMPAIKGHLSENRGITFVNINDLVEEGIRDLPGIFRPAEQSDLKRTEEDDD